MTEDKKDTVPIVPMGRPTLEMEKDWEAQIDLLRLSGYQPSEIQKRVGLAIEKINKKIDILERRDVDFAEKADLGQKKRELDLQYLYLIRELRETIVVLSDTKDVKFKIECQRLIKEIISDRAKLWSIGSGNGGGTSTVRMQNVENVVLGGSLNKKQLNLIGDIIAGKRKPEEIGIDGDNPVIEVAASAVSGDC